jgi:nucleoside-diphosphate-sugar epimerase
VVGSRGTLHVDYVRGTVVRSLEAGTLGKIVNPYAEAWTRLVGTTGSLARRFLKRERFYPGLAEAFESFYRAIRSGSPSPVSDQSVLDTVDLCERTSLAIRARLEPSRPGTLASPTVAVTGGTGFLGAPTVRALLRRGVTPLVLARRVPPTAARVPGARYEAVDLGSAESLDLPSSVETVIHAAAETVGGWEAHERNSVQATRNLLTAMSRRGIDRLVYVSSIAVVARDAREPIAADAPTEREPRSRGPYVWGKLSGEEEAVRLGRELGIDVRVVRPSALVDSADFSPPGKLGRSLGPAFVAIGPKKRPLATIDVHMAGEVLAWTATNFDDAPAVLNLTDPDTPTRQQLVENLRSTVPGLRVFWVPWTFVRMVSAALWLPQKILRPGRPPIDLTSVFRSPRYEVEPVEKVLAMVRSAEASDPPAAWSSERKPALAE